MTWTVFQISALRLWNNKHEVALMLLLPISFFSIFAFIFSRGVDDREERVAVSFIDDDRSQLSEQVIQAAVQQPSLARATGVGHTTDDWPIARLSRMLITRKDASLIVHFPEGFAEQLRHGKPSPIELLDEGNNPVARQIVEAILSQALASELAKEKSSAMAAEGYLVSLARPGRFSRILLGGAAGSSAGSNPPIRSSLAVQSNDSAITQEEHPSVPFFEASPRQAASPPATTTGFSTPPTATADSSGSGDTPSHSGASIPMRRSVNPQVNSAFQFQHQNVFAYNKHHPKIAMYAAGIAVMFLLFSANGAGGSLLEEKEAGTLERLLSSRLTLTQLLMGKWLFIATLGSVQLTCMFLWGQLAFGIDLTGRWVAFAILAISTAGAGASFALLLATLCRSRTQLNGLSVILVLTMSALGGSMIPRYIMSDSMQRLGRLTFNGWALDGFQKLFWYDLPTSAIRTEVLVLWSIALILGVASRLVAPRWSVT